jgi:hypothetical protein
MTKKQIAQLVMDYVAATRIGPQHRIFTLRGELWTWAETELEKVESKAEGILAPASPAPAAWEPSTQRLVTTCAPSVAATSQS